MTLLPFINIIHSVSLIYGVYIFNVVISAIMLCIYSLQLFRMLCVDMSVCTFIYVVNVCAFIYAVNVCAFIYAGNVCAFIYAVEVWKNARYGVEHAEK